MSTSELLATSHLRVSALGLTVWERLAVSQFGHSLHGLCPPRNGDGMTARKDGAWYVGLAFEV